MITLRELLDSLSDEQVFCLRANTHHFYFYQCLKEEEEKRKVRRRANQVETLVKKRILGILLLRGEDGEDYE